jgi:hypothetical protein
MGSSKELVNTDPYCPPIRTTSSDDTPLVVKSSEELPLVVRRSSHAACCQRAMRHHWTNSHVDTTADVAKLYERHCHRRGR